MFQVTDPTRELHVLHSTGRWLCLAGLLLMISGDAPIAMLGASSWPMPFRALAWSRLYLALLVLGIVCVAIGGGARPSRMACLDAVMLPLGLLLGAFLLSTVASDAPILSAWAFLAVLCFVSAGWAFIVLTKDERFWGAIGPVVAVALILLGANIILWRYHEGLHTEAYHVRSNMWVGKQQLAWVLNLFSPLLLAWAVGTPKRGLAAFYAITWVVTGAALYVLYSRTGVIVFVTTTAGVLMFTRSEWRRTLGIVIVAAVVATALIDRTREMARYVATTIADPGRDTGVEWRLGIWQDTIRLFRSRPMTGHGLGTYDVAVYTLQTNRADPAFRGAGWHAHNVYLHLLAETGLLGVVTWCSFWSAILVQLGRALRRAHPRDRHWLVGALGVVCAFLLLSMSEVMIAARVHASVRMNLTLAFLVALALSACHRASPESFRA